MGAIYLVRHGQASFGSADYDQLSDVGAEQSKVVGNELRRRGVEFTEVRCGTMVRQHDTASAAGFDAVADERWNEYDFIDVLRGHGAELPEPVDPRGFQAALDEALLAWIAAADGSACMEPWTSFADRVNSAFDELAEGLPKGGSALVFTSGGVIGALAARAIGDQPGRFTALHRVTCNAGITKLVTGRSGLTLLAFNEHAHFEAEHRSLLTYR
ncbi:histidine phosphatase family protein [Haloechinothrix salitolerans]|uniref:Histidine phosphatase family protein n=1 Tax=Haloechinothrix salitolerans TaxID=926830 RepID=A0ABW2C772_9PSEU